MARKQPKVWQLSRRSPRPVAPDAIEKLTIISVCEAFIREVLKPRFLREVSPTQRNHMVDIHGSWAAGRYRFMRRYRSGFEDNRGMEFDAPFARIDRLGRDQFNIEWMRHTGQWWPLYSAVTLAEALRILETDPVLHPH